MIHLTRALIRRWLDTLLHIDDTPERTAAAFALGVFFGFSPFLGFHTLLGILAAFLLNLNRVAVLLAITTWCVVRTDNFRRRILASPDHDLETAAVALRRWLDFWRAVSGGVCLPDCARVRDKSAPHP